MLTRYRMRRGARREELPEGIRQDTRKHTRHPLRPAKGAVAAYLAAPGDAAWSDFSAAWLADAQARFAADPAPFDAIAAAARAGDVHLGCSCPTAKNPDVRRCHTWLALQFMAERYPDLDVRFPPISG